MAKIARMGRPTKEFDKKQFVDLVGMGCNGDEICFWFRDTTGKPANINTISAWCKREFGMTFQEYSRQNKNLLLKIKLRRNQAKLSETSAAMAIFLGKNILGQTDEPIKDNIGDDPLEELLRRLDDESNETAPQS